MKKVKWGILSTANIGRTQVIPAIMRAENAEVIAIASRGEKVHEVAREFGIEQAYTSYEELLDDPEVDAVYIPLPNDLHKQWVIQAAEKGKHLLCEKPVALTSAEAREMADVCQKNQVVFMEAFMYQFHPQHLRVKEILASGEIGEVKLLKSSHSFYLENRTSDIRMKKEQGGGSLYDVGCYSIHAFRDLLGNEPLDVTVSATIDPLSGVDLSAYGRMTFPEGITATFDCSFEMTPRNEYEVIGTKGRITVPYAFRPDMNGGIGHVIVTANQIRREEKVEGDLYRIEIELFSQSVLDRTKPRYTPEMSIKNMKVIDACYQSIETKQVVEVKK